MYKISCYITKNQQIEPTSNDLGIDKTCST